MIILLYLALYKKEEGTARTALMLMEYKHELFGDKTVAIRMGGERV